MPNQPLDRDRDLPFWITAAAVAGGFAALVWLERRFPLRETIREPKATRDSRNIALAALAGAVMQIAERPVTNRITLHVRLKQVGLLPQLRLPGWLDTILGVVLLDATLYYWHYLTHKIPFLWRFHRVHHADLDMDASTGLRFHAGEMLISVLFRALQIRALGISRRALSVWNTLLLVEVMFHHSNIELPPHFQARIGKLIVTPRIHAIHHSLVPDELNSNWSSGLTVWDWMHGTYRRSARQADAALTIGVPELRSPRDVTLPKLLAMPFDKGLPPPPKS